MKIPSNRLALLATFAAALVSASCASSSATSDRPDPACGSADPCACVTPAAGETCVVDGVRCRCTIAGDAEPPEAAPPPEASAPDLRAFVGRWSPLSGTGESRCGGVANPLPPDTGAVLTFTQDGPGTLTATSSGADGCSLELRVQGGVASLAEASEPCDVPGGGVVSFTTFRLTPVGAAGDEDGGADGGTSESDAAPAPSQDRLDWQLGDGDGTCTTTLHYTLVRIPSP